MSRRTRRLEFRAYEFVARPRGNPRIKDGVDENYWTVRCRRKGSMGEWSLGWHPSNRSAEYAFFKWVEQHRDTPAPTDWTAMLVDVIDQYMQMVPTMAKRPMTKQNRLFRAKTLVAFVNATDASMNIGSFDSTMFQTYLGWLESVRGYSPQTIQNLLIGARTLLKWGAAKGLVAHPPKVPAFRVPAPQHEVLYAEDVEATVTHAVAPLNLMLRLMWESGLRVSEAASTRGCDLLPDDRLVVVQARGGFVPKTIESARRVPVTEELMADLQRLASTRDAMLFPCDVGRVYHYWRHRLYKAQKAAGVRRFTFHDLRRAVADRLRNSQMPLDRYAKFMGHAPITAIRHYSTIAPGDLHADLQAGLEAARRRPVAPSEEDASDE